MKSSPNVFLRARRIHLEYINVVGQNAKKILPRMENTTIDIKLSLTRRVFGEKTKNILDPKSPW